MIIRSNFWRSGWPRLLRRIKSRLLAEKQKVNIMKYDEAVSLACDRVRAYIDDGEVIRDLLKRDGPHIIQRLLNMPHYECSLRQLARKIKKLVAYLSRITNGHIVISPRLFIELSEMLMRRERSSDRA